MSRSPSSFLSAAALASALFGWSEGARAQACCAGGSALTPGRLAPQERFLAGMQARASYVFATFEDNGHYTTTPRGASEVDLEQDVFGAVRFLDHGQVALLVPIVETHRKTQTSGPELGGGIGDVNLSARYDFTLAGDSPIVPGIGVLAGITFPTGKAPDDPGLRPLGTDATGTGAFQGNVGLALEQNYGSWLVNLTGLVAKRAARDVQGIHSLLGTQVTILAAGGYTFANDASLVLVASYSVEGDATIDGNDVPGSARRVLLTSLAGLYPLNHHFRFTGSVFMNPPIPYVGKNLPATTGLTVGAVYAWF